MAIEWWTYSHRDINKRVVMGYWKILGKRHMNSWLLAKSVWLSRIDRMSVWRIPFISNFCLSVRAIQTLINKYSIMHQRSKHHLRIKFCVCCIWTLREFNVNEYAIIINKIFVEICVEILALIVYFIPVEKQIVSWYCRIAIYKILRLLVFA